MKQILCFKKYYHQEDCKFFTMRLMVKNDHVGCTLDNFNRSEKFISSGIVIFMFHLLSGVSGSGVRYFAKESFFYFKSWSHSPSQTGEKRLQVPIRGSDIFSSENQQKRYAENWKKSWIIRQLENYKKKFSYFRYHRKNSLFFNKLMNNPNQSVYKSKVSWNKKTLIINLFMLKLDFSNIWYKRSDYWVFFIMKSDDFYKFFLHKIKLFI